MNMKTIQRFGIMLLIVVAAVSCKDRAAEKRIAELESRLSAMESNKNPSAGAVSAVPAAPAQTPPAQETKPEGPLPVATFEKVEHDFGTVREGQKVTYTYKFKNTGEVPLIIQNASPSCGCTVPDWSKEPIAVGGTGFVKAEFDSQGKPGIQNKTIMVTANTWPKTTTLRFKAMVTPKPDGANGPVK